MSKKNILVLTHNFIRSKEDVAGQFVFTLTRELGDDFEVFVLAPHQKGTKTYEEIENLRIFRFRYNFPRFEKLAYKGNMHERVFGSFLSRVNFLFFLLAFFLYTLTIIEKQKIELLHCHWWIPTGVIGYLVSFLFPFRLYLPHMVRMSLLYESFDGLFRWHDLSLERQPSLLRSRLR